MKLLNPFMKKQRTTPPHNIAGIESHLMTSKDKAAFARLADSINRIYEATQIPPIPPSDYRLLFSMIARECQAGTPAQVRSAVLGRAQGAGIFAREDVDFVLDALQRTGAGLTGKTCAATLARLYRDFVLEEYRQAITDPSPDELILINAWFGPGVSEENN
jgi:hypothetical protein